jgi:hypothetical protein
LSIKCWTVNGVVTGTMSIAATLFIQREVEFKLVHMIQKNYINTCVLTGRSVLL